MGATIIIDPNVRVEGGLTFAGFEDLIDGVVPDVGASVRVCEPESGLVGVAEVARVDSERGLVYLSVDWATLRPAQVAPTEVALNYVVASGRGVATHSAWTCVSSTAWNRGVNYYAVDPLEQMHVGATDHQVLTNSGA